MTRLCAHCNAPAISHATLVIADTTGPTHSISGHLCAACVVNLLRDAKGYSLRSARPRSR